jgi:tetratricopeptide (TPR) repeat protein
MFRPVVSVFFLSLAVPAAPAPGSDAWVEVRSPAFTVVSDGSEKDAREVAWQFEQVRALLNKAWPWARLDLSRPVTILAVRNEGGLRALVPDFWEEKGSAHPAGLFLKAPDRNWVALRMDVAEVRQHDSVRNNPYLVIFHEYVHLALHANFRGVPPWLDEGLAEFWGNTIVERGTVYEGWPLPHHLETLRVQSPMPIAKLFAVTRSSPEYSEQKRVDLFYAQSWALAHYLILGADGRRGQINAFAQGLRQGRAESEAAREAFGDLDALGQELKSYARESKAFRARPRDVSGGVDAGSFKARSLPPAETLAVRALLHAARGRSADARALAQESLALEPGPAAQEAIAISAIRRNQGDEALGALERAVASEGASDYAHFLYAQALWRSAAGAKSLERVEASLRKAVELNPSFAEAYAEIARVGMERGAPVDSLFPYAKRAIELEPEELEHRLLAVRIAARAGEVEAARDAAEQMLTTAQGEDRPRVEALVAELASIEPTSPAAAPVTASLSRAGARAPQGSPAAWGVFASPDGKARLSERDEMLEIHVPGGAYDLSPEIGQLNAPRLLRPAEGDFVAKVTLPRAPQPTGRGGSANRRPYNGIGLLLWQNESNFVRLELAAYLAAGSGATVRYALFEWRRNGVPVAGLASSHIRLDATRTELRLERRGNAVQALVRQRSHEWTEVARLDIPLPPTVYVGVAAVNTAGEPLDAQFADFTLAPP